jgi:dGTPase
MTETCTHPANANANDFGASLPPGARDPASYAASRAPSRGRVFPERPCPTRNHLQRDRDRILHATAFRRLTYKTQMFVYHEGDHYRTRLTHSLEVAQIARTISRQLRLDEDLAEALSLAHDLGHPPFGHAGERALDCVIKPFGGFDHNVQSFRIVTALERKYPDFDGLNLTWETLEGLVKHNGPPQKSPSPMDDGISDATLVHALRKFGARMDLGLDTFASGEAQAAAIADDIAWHTHDIDDGMRAGLINRDDLRAVPILARVIDDIPAASAGDQAREVYEVTRRLITIIIADCVGEARRRLAETRPETPDDIRQAGRTLVTFSVPMWADLKALRAFLFERLYHHPRVMRVMRAAEDVVQDLVVRYREDLSALPREWQPAGYPPDEHRLMRRICDFVAGMTDRYAIAEHRRLFDVTPELR